MNAKKIVIVGGVAGGASAAARARRLSEESEIVLLERGPHISFANCGLAYHIGGEIAERERLLVSTPEKLRARFRIDVRTRSEAVAIDTAAREVEVRNLETGATYRERYDALVLSPGAEPVRPAIPGVDGPNVLTLRNMEDMDRIIAALAGKRHVTVIGGGYIGLEAAAVLRKLGKEVTLLEVLPRVLARVAGPQLSAFYEAEHRSHGVDLRTETGVDQIVGDTRVTGVKLADGSVIDCQLVIVGIGIIPAVGPLLAAGAAGGNGVDVDEFCRTSLPDVYAIGDCAAHANAFADGAEIRLESVQNASDQAGVAAKHILGLDAAYAATPWFWSNQYDLRLQTAGLSGGHDATVLRGDPDSGSFTLAYFRGGRLIALDCVNCAKDYVQGRKLIEEGMSPDPEALADASVPLKEVQQL